jgi:hypothetical protein
MAWFLKKLKQFYFTLPDLFAYTFFDSISGDQVLSSTFESVVYSMHAAENCG